MFNLQKAFCLLVLYFKLNNIETLTSSPEKSKILRKYLFLHKNAQLATANKTSKKLNFPQKISNKAENRVESK